MRVTSLASTLLGAALALATCVRAANIDSGFTQDGVATYCQGLSTGTTGVFPNLDANSLNRCPILVNITPGATTIHKNEALEIKFKAQAKFGDIPGNIFPRAITDQAAKKVAAVTSSFMKSCKAGTNCGTPMDGTPFGAESNVGDFDATGAKTLQAHRFTFTETGDYVIYGQVTLPGDPELNVSGQQFIAFLKITVVDTGASIAPSPSPTPSMPATTPAPSTSSVAPSPSNATSVGFDTLNNSSKASGSVAGDAATVKGAVESTAAPTPVSDTPTSGTTTKDSKDDEDQGFFASHGVLLAIVAGACVVVLVIGYAVAMRRKNKNVSAHKLQRGPTPTFQMSGHNDPMDDPEPVAYISKKSARNSHSVNQHSLPILGGHASTSSTDDMPIAKAGSEMAPSFDEMESSYEEGTVTASNKAISTQSRGQQQSGAHPSRPSSVASNGMAPSSLYDDRETALYQGKATKSSVRDSEQERGFYQSETWDGAATARPYDAREVSTISFNDDSSSRRGFEAPSFTSETMDEDYEANRISRLNSEASVDSYAFRPSRASVAESYQSRVSRYSYADSDFDRESSRISGMSLYSDRGTNV